MRIVAVLGGRVKAWRWEGEEGVGFGASMKLLVLDGRCDFAPTCARLLRADFRRDVALKYVKRGYHVLCTHLLTLLLVPLAATGVVRFCGSADIQDAQLAACMRDAASSPPMPC